MRFRIYFTNIIEKKKLSVYQISRKTLDESFIKIGVEMNGSIIEKKICSINWCKTMNNFLKIAWGFVEKLF